MNRNKIIYHNTIPPIKADCLLPKFKIPNFSLKFSTDSTLNKPSHEFRTDALLGMNIQLCDLSVYDDCTPDTESFDEHDFMYYRELAERTQKDMLVVPVKTLIPRSHLHIDAKNQRERNQEKSQKNYYRKSKKFYKSINDPEIEEQLQNAFNGNIPQGEVNLIHQAPPLCSMIYRQIVKPLNKESLILLSTGKNYLKVHDPPSEEDQPNIATKAFSVTEKDTESNIEKAYLYVDENGEYNLGVIRKNLILRAVPKKDMMRERLTATPVIFQNTQIVKRAHQSHSETEDIDNKDNKPPKRSSSASSFNSRSGSASGSARNSNSSSRSSSSRSNSGSGSGSNSDSASGSDEETIKARHRIRAKDAIDEGNSKEDKDDKNNSSHSSDNEKKVERSPSPRLKSRSNSGSNSDAESRKKSRSSSRSNSDTESRKKSGSSSRSNSDIESRKKSRSNSGSNSDAESRKKSRSSSRSNSDSESRKKSSSRSNSASGNSSSRPASDNEDRRKSSQSNSNSNSKSSSRHSSRSSSRAHSSNSDDQKD